MTALTSALTAALIDFVWQGVLVACLLWITLFILRNRSANARYLASCAGLLAMFAVPIITAYVAYRPIAMGPALSGAHLAIEPAVILVATTSSVLWIERWAIPVWSLGVVLFSLRLVWGCWQLSSFRRRGAAAGESIGAMVEALSARMGLTHTVRVLTSTLAEAPGVAGFLRPVILLPVSSITGLTPQQLEVILAHELAHIRRWDPLVNALQILIETLLFYHPAVWWTSTRIRHERELCCDDMAVRFCGDALCYARALTTLEKLRGVPGALVIGSNGGSLLYRIRRIMGERPSDYSPSKTTGIIAMTLAIACLAVNVGSRMKAQEPPKYQSPGVQVDAAGAEVLQPIRYPREAAQKAIQGTVVVQADVDAQGNVSDARVLSGPPELRKAVLQPVLTWRFKPEGTPTTRQVTAAFQVPLAQELELRENNGERFQRSAQEFEARRRAEQSSAEKERLEQINALRAQLKQLEALKSAEPKNDAREMGRDIPISGMMAQLLEMERAASSVANQAERPGGMEGRVLAQTDIIGLSEEQRAELVTHLPVKPGDTLSREAIEHIRQVIRSVDERLRFEMVPLENNQAVLKIIMPSRTYHVQSNQEQLLRLEKRIAERETQLADARNQLTDAHPDVLRLKAELLELRRQLEEQAARIRADETDSSTSK